MQINIDNFYLCLSCKNVSFLGQNITLNAPIPRSLTCDSCLESENIWKWNDTFGYFESEAFTKFVEFQLLDSFITDEEQKGINGETLFMEWLNDNRIPYIYVEQSKESFSKVFDLKAKRPDFLIASVSKKSVFVDVKNRAFYSNGSETFLTLDTAKVGSRYLEFSKLFNIPVWFSYIDHRAKGNWLWISALTAIDKGMQIKSKNGDEFLSINIKEFAEVNDINTLESLLR